MDKREKAESTMYRFLAFLLAASVIVSFQLGWAAIAAWLLSAISLMTFFYVSTGKKQSPPKKGSCNRTRSRR